MKKNLASQYLKKKRNNTEKRKAQTEDLVLQVQRIDVQQDTQTFNWTRNTGIDGRDVNIMGNANVNIAGPRQQAQENVKKLFGVVYPSDPFTGRYRLLVNLTGKINQCLDKNEWKNKTVVISGLGGVGKTELVREYVRNAVKTNLIQHVAVIDAASYKTAKESFRDLARDIFKDRDALQFDTRIEIKNAVDSVYNYFASQKGDVTIFIFENVTQLSPGVGEKVGILSFLPTKLFGNDQKCPLSLIISRKNNWTDITNHVQVGAWNSNEAEEYLTSRFNHMLEEDDIPNREIQRRSIRSLAAELSGFPLGLTIATSNILDDKGPPIAAKIQNYIEYKRGNNENWRLQKLSETSFNDYPFTMDDVFEADIDRIYSNENDGKKALQLLHLISLHCSDLAEITEERIKSLCSQNDPDTEVKLNDALQALYKYSIFVTTTEGLLPCQIHKIIQLCESKWVGEYLRSYFS